MFRDPLTDEQCDQWMNPPAARKRGNRCDTHWKRHKREKNEERLAPKRGGAAVLLLSVFTVLLCIVSHQPDFGAMLAKLASAFHKSVETTAWHEYL